MMSRFRLIFEAVLLLLSPVSIAAESVLSPLVAQCDLIDDEIVGKSVGHQARLDALRCMAGKIGPVTYIHHASKKGAENVGGQSSFGTILSEERARQLGGPKIPPPKGRYDTITPPGFDAIIKRWVAKAKTGNPEACAEIGAVVFLDAQPAKLNFSEQRMFQCFKLAGDAGNADAKFMTGVCLYYGIGCTRSKKKSFEALKSWKEASGTTKANRGGWVARRFAEINK